MGGGAERVTAGPLDTCPWSGEAWPTQHPPGATAHVCGSHWALWQGVGMP